MQSEDEEDIRQLKRCEEGPQLLLLSESNGDRVAGPDGSKDNYTPVQFTNSLGKLQAISVKAPRKIIDIGCVNIENEGATLNQKEMR